MSKPSKEAMAAAEKLVRMEVAHETPDCTLVVAGVELYSVNASQGPMAEMYDTVTELQAGIAAAIDDHTADLRKEVEALRAERDELKQWLEHKRTATEKSIWVYLTAADDTTYYDGVLSAFGEVIERLSE